MNNLTPNPTYNNYTKDLYVNCPVPEEKWLNLSMASRLDLVRDIMSEEEKSLMDVKLCNDDGYIYVELLEPVIASKRGVFLLEFEFKLKDRIDQALTVWHIPQGDKSSLRRLRGVEVKS